MLIWKIIFCSRFFSAFNITYMERKAVNRHILVLLRVVWQIEISRAWFRCAFAINFDIFEMQAELVTQSPPRLADEYFSTQSRFERAKY